MKTSTRSASFSGRLLHERVGVYSLYHLGDKANYETFLKRTMKLAVHETGHMFSISHCTKYVCVMSGTNHLGETDRRPIDACPECMAKICWISKQMPQERARKLQGFCGSNGLRKEAEEFGAKAKALAGI